MRAFSGSVRGGGCQEGLVGLRLTAIIFGEHDTEFSSINM